MGLRGGLLLGWWRLVEAAAVAVVAALPGAGDVGCGPSQVGADAVEFDFEAGAFVAFFCFPFATFEVSAGDDGVAFVEGFGDVFGEFATKAPPGVARAPKPD